MSAENACKLDIVLVNHVDLNAKYPHSIKTTEFANADDAVDFLFRTEMRLVDGNDEQQTIKTRLLSSNVVCHHVGGYKTLFRIRADDKEYPNYEMNCADHECDFFVSQVYDINFDNVYNVDMDGEEI